MSRRLKEKTNECEKLKNELALKSDLEGGVGRGEPGTTEMTIVPVIAPASRGCGFERKGEAKEMTR